MKITQAILDELKHDGEAARQISETVVVRVTCEVLLSLIAEIENDRLIGLRFEAAPKHPAHRD